MGEVEAFQVTFSPSARRFPPPPSLLLLPTNDNSATRRRQRRAAASLVRLSSSRRQSPSAAEQSAIMRSAKAVVSENRYSGLDRSQLDGSLPQDQSRMPSRTITGLKRWSVANRELPGGFYLLLPQKAQSGG